MPTPPLAGKSALVTGANHGIGAATATTLAELGADVAVTYLRTGNPNRSDNYNTARAADGSLTKAAIESHGRRAFALEADLSEKHDVAREHPEITRQLVKLAEEVRAELGDVGVVRKERPSVVLTYQRKNR